MPLDESDVAYVSGSYLSLAVACALAGFDEREIRSAMLAGMLPLPSYVMPDGELMVPHDYFELLKEARTIDALQALFRDRLSAAAKREGVPMDDSELESAWFGYLSGHYGICLKQTTPENMVRKTKLIGEICALLDEPRPTSTEWCQRLRGAVDELDALERTFAHYDLMRFGRLSSRAIYIDQVRERHSDVFRGGSTV
jgi:hypothetical protein